MIQKILIFIVILLISIQFIPLKKTNPPIDKAITLKAPEDVMTLLKQACYDCHSNETKWPYYSNIAPISFFVTSHVNKGRKALNFSEWEEIDSKIKLQRLKRAIITLNNEMMALPSYKYAHNEANLNKEQKKILTQWLDGELNSINK